MSMTRHLHVPIYISMRRPCTSMSLHQIHHRAHMHCRCVYMFLLEQIPLRRDRPHPVGADPPTRIMRRTGKCARKAAHAAGEKRPATAHSRNNAGKAVHPCCISAVTAAKLSRRLKSRFTHPCILTRTTNIRLEQTAPLQACTRSVEQRKQLHACLRSIEQNNKKYDFVYLHCLIDVVPLNPSTRTKRATSPISSTSYL